MSHPYLGAGVRRAARIARTPLRLSPAPVPAEPAHPFAARRGARRVAGNPQVGVFSPSAIGGFPAQAMLANPNAALAFAGVPANPLPTGIPAAGVPGNRSAAFAAS